MSEKDRKVRCPSCGLITLSKSERFDEFSSCSNCVNYEMSQKENKRLETKKEEVWSLVKDMAVGYTSGPNFLSLNSLQENEAGFAKDIFGLAISLYDKTQEIE